MRGEGVVVHELIHLFQHIGTPLGLLTDALWRAGAVTFGQTAESLVNQHGYLRKPLLAWLTEEPAPRPDVARFAKGVRIEVLRQTILGITQVPPELLTRLLTESPELLEWLRLLEASEVDTFHLESLWAHVAMNQRKCHPIFSVPEARSGLLGATSVWEGWARWTECSFIPNGWRSADHWTQRYASAPSVFSALTGMDVYPRGVHPTCGGLTFLAVCDLASQTPMHPIFQPLCSSQMSWQDFHPGWRYLAACRAVNNLPPLCGRSTNPVAMVDNAVANYRKFTDAISELYGWPTPSALAQRSLHVDSADWPLRELNQAACEMRLQNPAFFAFSALIPEVMEEAEQKLALPEVGIDLLHGWTLTSKPLHDSSIAKRHRILGKQAQFLHQLAFTPGEFDMFPYPEIHRIQPSPRQRSPKEEEYVEWFLNACFRIGRSSLRVDPW
ncbi:hypothetical protein QFZ56_002629 [Streptomyces achromogenes]|uniref:Uncharacterized protein n=1 Tax=Streptomyces achromogenes TaxID=67255 RepID=A0ABU0Q0E3_STRAH|nr:hypothetical protein [Streptomyces achromogenes]